MSKIKIEFKANVYLRTMRERYGRNDKLILVDVPDNVINELDKCKNIGLLTYTVLETIKLNTHKKKEKKAEKTVKEEEIVPPQVSEPIDTSDSEDEDEYHDVDVDADDTSDAIESLYVEDEESVPDDIDIKTILTSIKGIGTKLSEKLLDEYGSLEGIYNADESDISQKVNGISYDLALKVKKIIENYIEVN